MIRLSPPVNYRRSDGTLGEISAHLRRAWPWPRMAFDEPTSTWWIELPANTNGWRQLGWAPHPGHSRRRWFAYHVHHGRLMRIPWRHVLVYAWRFSRRGELARRASIRYGRR